MSPEECERMLKAMMLKVRERAGLLQRSPGAAATAVAKAAGIFLKTVATCGLCSCWMGRQMQPSKPQICLSSPTPRPTNPSKQDLRIQCRARGLSPAGGKEQLTDRLKDAMIATNDL